MGGCGVMGCVWPRQSVVHLLSVHRVRFRDSLPSFLAILAPDAASGVRDATPTHFGKVPIGASGKSRAEARVRGLRLKKICWVKRGLGAWNNKNHTLSHDFKIISRRHSPPKLFSLHGWRLATPLFWMKNGGRGRKPKPDWQTEGQDGGDPLKTLDE